MAVRQAELQAQLQNRLQQEVDQSGLASTHKAQPSITVSVLPVLHKV